MEEYLRISVFFFQSSAKETAESTELSCLWVSAFSSCWIKLLALVSTPLAKAEVALKGSKVFWVQKRCDSLPVTCRSFLSWGCVGTLPRWGVAAVMATAATAVRLSPASGAFEGRCEGEWEPGRGNYVCAFSSSLLGIKLTMPATLFSLVLEWKAVFGVGNMP